ncbi:MAG TPA: hypothetical protein VN859_08630, partial [Steroidobacteraceae bacterium]|nr:hypothetical protein [Steroidobacteraceae bacterium]
MRTRLLLIVAASACALAGIPARGAGVRDPMRPPAPAASPHAAPSEADPTVSAIFSSGEQRAAIVGGRLVHAGDSVGRCLIEAILEE